MKHVQSISRYFVVSVTTAGILFFAVSLVGAGCASLQSTAATGAYGAKLQQCEQEAGTHDAAMACRCGVDKEFAVDGGNCSAK